MTGGNADDREGRRRRRSTSMPILRTRRTRSRRSAASSRPGQPWRPTTPRSSSPSTHRIRLVPVHRLLGQLQPDHPPGELRPGGLGQHVHRHRAVHDAFRTRPRSVRASRAIRELLGHAGTARRASRSRTTRTSRPHVLALVGKQVDGIDQFGAVGGQAILADPDSFRSSQPPDAPPAALDAQRHEAVRRQAGQAGDRADPRPPGDHRHALEGLRRPRERQPDGAFLPP